VLLLPPPQPRAISLPLALLALQRPQRRCCLWQRPVCVWQLGQALLQVECKARRSQEQVDHVQALVDG
jgi:hypothetical protein